MSPDVRARIAAAALAALPGWERWPVSEGVGLRRGRAYVRLTEAGDVVTVGPVPADVVGTLAQLAPVVLVAAVVAEAPAPAPLAASAPAHRRRPRRERVILNPCAAPGCQGSLSSQRPGDVMAESWIADFPRPWCSVGDAVVDANGREMCVYGDQGQRALDVIVFYANRDVVEVELSRKPAAARHECPIALSMERLTITRLSQDADSRWFLQRNVNNGVDPQWVDVVLIVHCPFCGEKL